jgi:uncharacterized protein YabN with tetrapyrrole methylase and pyrophosphatase domain
MTAHAWAQIDRAERVLFHVNDPVLRTVIVERRPDAESLDVFYALDLERQVTYDRMVDRILAGVRAGQRVCVVLYGHPGVFAFPAHEAIKISRAEGYTAVMFPAVSAEDCLFADLGIDPAEHGCVSVEATDFLIHDRIADRTMSLILWQIGAIGMALPPQEVSLDGLQALTEVLLRTYPGEHVVHVYEAAQFSVGEARVESVALCELPNAPVALRSTLYVPPCREPRKNVAMLARFGLAAVAS